MNDSDAVIPNGKHIAKLRKSCGLTQQSLANECGYAIRTIGKAERGDRIRYSSLVAIATTLQRLGVQTSALQLCSNPEEIVQQFVEAYRLHEADMVDKIRHLLSEDLEVFIAGDPSKIPFAGSYQGISGLQDFWNEFFRLLERPDKDAIELTYYTNGNEVVAYGTEVAHIRGLVNDEPTWLSLLFRVKGGLIVRFEDYFDTAPAQAQVEAFRQSIREQNQAS